MTSSAWVRMATGANPGAHGVHSFQERVPGQYLLRPPTASDRKAPRLLERASTVGLSVITARCR
jgi:predicted AlkP superfamily phosphohydrolase/phosphomutase